MELLASLVNNGCIRETDGHSGFSSCYTTIKGNALANASAAPQISRSTADRNLSAFLERVRAANENPAFTLRVVRVAVFGSYLGSADRLSDVDLALTLAPRFSDGAAQRELEQKQINAAVAAGHRFGGMVDELFWPEKELLLYLKSGTRSLHLTDACDEAIAGCKVIFEDRQKA